MRSAIYIRVSTDKQDPENQLADLLGLAKQREWEPTIFREVESGAKKRPVLEELLKRCQRGEFPVLQVWALDRLGRTAFETAGRLRDLMDRKVIVSSYRDGWVETTSGPIRELMVFVMAWFADWERQSIIARTKAGVDAAKARGVKLGRKPVDPDMLRLAVELVGAGHSHGTAAEGAGISVASLRRELARRRKGAANG